MILKQNQLENHEVPLIPVIEGVLREKEAELRELFRGNVRVEIQSLGWQAARVMILLDKQNVGSAGFEIEQMPGCCAIGTTSYMYLDRKYRRLYPYFAKLRAEIAKAAKWGILIATLTDGQEIQSAILEKEGWERGYKRFFNPKTNNGINIWVKDVTNDQAI